MYNFLTIFLLSTENLLLFREVTRGKTSLTSYFYIERIERKFEKIKPDSALELQTGENIFLDWSYTQFLFCTFTVSQKKEKKKFQETRLKEIDFKTFLCAHYPTLVAVKSAWKVVIRMLVNTLRCIFDQWSKLYYS